MVMKICQLLQLARYPVKKPLLGTAVTGRVPLRSMPLSCMSIIMLKVALGVESLIHPDNEPVTRPLSTECPKAG